MSSTRSSAALLAAALVALASNARAEPPPVVHLETPRAPGLPQIERRSPDGIWQRICEEPCDVRLPLGFDYRVGGRGVVDSAPFQLPRGASEITIRAKVGSSILQGMGTAFLVGGLVFLTGAAALLALPDKPSPDSPRVVAIGFAAMGGLTLGVGLALHFGSSTEVELRPMAAR